MPSNNSKYTQEIREQTARYILDSGKSATSISEEMGIDKNTVCRWVRDYRRGHEMPSYAEENGIQSKQPQTEGEIARRIKELKTVAYFAVEIMSVDVVKYRSVTFGEHFYTIFNMV